MFINLFTFYEYFILVIKFRYQLLIFIFSYWKGKFPRQGWLYLSVNYACFHAYILGRESTVCIRWADVTELSKTNSLMFPDSIKIATREKEYHFSMFIKKAETFALMEQLANLAMKQ